MPCRLPGTLPPSFSASGLAGQLPWQQVTRPAGRDSGWALAELSGSLRGWLPAKAQALLLLRRPAGMSSHGHTQSPPVSLPWELGG